MTQNWEECQAKTLVGELETVVEAGSTMYTGTATGRGKNYSTKQLGEASFALYFFSLSTAWEEEK